MLLDLGEILLEVRRDVFQVGCVIRIQLVCAVIQYILQVIQQLDRHLAEINHKVQRILYFMGNAGTEQPQGCHLVLFLQLLLQVFHLILQAFHIFFAHISYLTPS